MAISPRQQGSPALRTRSKGSGVVKPFCSCSKVIVGLLLLQLFGVFWVAFNVGSSIGGLEEAWSSSPNNNVSSSAGRGGGGDTSGHGSGVVGEESDDDSSNNSPEAVVDPEMVKKWEELEKIDPRQHRILYSSAEETDQSQSSSSAALDNYGARKHFIKPTVTTNNAINSTAPYLIVGGSDGSGTRAMVKTLIELGAFFHVEDRSTMDIHGSEMFHKGGWPPLVNLIMKHTHSANYQVADLPEEVRSTAMAELTRLKKGIDIRSQAKIKHAKMDHKAVGIHVGWKAPVSMILLPLLREVFGSIKFLHVVRDGRDVSFSDNKSPVHKFFNTYYGLPEDKNKSGHNNLLGKLINAVDHRHIGDAAPPVQDEKTLTIKAMQLWNDWNHQVYQYGNTNADGDTFDYLVVRSEDLVNPETKLEALLQLADFVGSKKSLQQLCCMSQKELKDLGKSTNGWGGRGRTRPDRGGMMPMDGRRGIPKRMGEGRTNVAKEAMMDSRLFGDAVDFNYVGDRDRYSDLASGDQEQTQSLIDKIDKHKRAMEDKLLIRPKGDHRGPDKKWKQYPPEFFQKRPHRRLIKLSEEGNAGRPDQHRNHTGDSHVSSRLQVTQPDVEAMRRNLGRYRTRRGARQRYESEAPEKVLARYGKWVKRLENEPELSKKLHELGGPALKVFGYEPAVSFIDQPGESYLQQCQDMLHDIVCPAPR